jgi:hypothetical protein
MNDEFTSLVKSLKVPLLTAMDVATLTQLQKQWEHWKQRELEHLPLRIEPHQKAAYDAFLANPTAEAEQRMLVLADRNLTGIRYALLRRACADLRARIGAQAAAIVKPIAERILAAVQEEHDRRLERAAPLKWDKNKEPGVVEAQRAADHAFGWSSRLISAARTGDQQPLQMADVLMHPDLLPVLTPDPKP